MRFVPWLRRYWPETLLFMAVALPWLSLFALGLVWLWQGGHVLVWALAAAALGLLAWPLSTLVHRRANEEARLALGDLAAPSRPWNAVESVGKVGLVLSGKLSKGDGRCTSVGKQILGMGPHKRKKVLHSKKRKTSTQKRSILKTAPKNLCVRNFPALVVGLVANQTLLCCSHGVT
jgi:hypothetical protein